MITVTLAANRNSCAMLPSRSTLSLWPCARKTIRTSDCTDEVRDYFLKASTCESFHAAIS